MSHEHNLERERQTDNTLSSLSTADEMLLIFSEGTPHTSKIPSRIFLWFSLLEYPGQILTILDPRKRPL